MQGAYPLGWAGFTGKIFVADKKARFLGWRKAALPPRVAFKRQPLPFCRGSIV